MLKKKFDIPISAASGMVLLGDYCYIIGDNYNGIYSHNLKNNTSLITPFPNLIQGDIISSKKKKKDLESIFYDGNKVVIFPSGSTPNRVYGYWFFISDSIILEEFDAQGIFEQIGLQAGISGEDLNIEGGFVSDGVWYLFNRGNGPSSENCVFVIEVFASLSTCKFLRKIDLELPIINGVQGTFTDFTLLNQEFGYGIIVFENTTDTYLDGENQGSYLVSLNMETFELGIPILLDSSQKFEGISIRRIEPDKITFWLCQDNDGLSNDEQGIHEFILEI